MNRIIKLISPQKAFEEKTVCVTTYRVPITNSCSTVYDAIDLLRNKKIVYDQREKKQNYAEEIIELRNVLNIHNDSGIKDHTQIESMVRKIQSGEHIVSAEGIPNIKLVKVNYNQWLLFDGHHSMLAYMHAGKKYLYEVAHLTVENEGVKNIADDDIMVFFGLHSNKIRGKDWRSYVINWQAPQHKQLCPRIQKNMGELYDAVSVRITAY
jgi:hypothetical protein